MACSAGDQGLAPPCEHRLDPVGHWPPPGALEGLDVSDVVHLDVDRGTAQFAGLGEEPFEQLGARIPDPGRVVLEDGIQASCERDPAAECDACGDSADWHAEGEYRCACRAFIVADPDAA
jgi:hypothetical protein